MVLVAAAESAGPHMQGNYPPISIRLTWCVLVVHSFIALNYLN